MAIANCPRCNKMFQRAPGLKVCPSCVRAEEEAFVLVRDYLYEHPGADMFAVSTETGVDESLIVRFIKEGRLTTLEELAGGLRVECRRCAKPVASGTYCGPCLELMSDALKNSAQTLADSGSEEAAKIRRHKSFDSERRSDSSSRGDRR